MQWVQQAEAFKPSKYLTPSLVTSQLQCEPSESIPTPRLIIHTANEEFCVSQKLWLGNFAQLQKMQGSLQNH